MVIRVIPVIIAVDYSKKASYYLLKRTDGDIIYEDISDENRYNQQDVLGLVLNNIINKYTQLSAPWINFKIKDVLIKNDITYIMYGANIPYYIDNTLKESAKWYHINDISSEYKDILQKTVEDTKDDIF